jgi:hypothetical protein
LEIADEITRPRSRIGHAADMASPGATNAVQLVMLIAGQIKAHAFTADVPDPKRSLTDQG